MVNPPFIFLARAASSRAFRSFSCRSLFTCCRYVMTRSINDQQFNVSSIYIYMIIYVSLHIIIYIQYIYIYTWHMYNLPGRWGYKPNLQLWGPVPVPSTQSTSAVFVLTQPDWPGRKRRSSLSRRYAISTFVPSPAMLAQNQQNLQPCW